MRSFNIITVKPNTFWSWISCKRYWNRDFAAMDSLGVFVLKSLVHVRMPESRTFSTLLVPAEVRDVLSTCILRLSVTSSDVIDKLSTSICDAFAWEIPVVASAWSWWGLLFEVMHYDKSVETPDQAPILELNSSTTWHTWVNLLPFQYNQTACQYNSEVGKALWESIRRMWSGQINCAACSVWSLAPLHKYSRYGASTCLSTSHMEIASHCSSTSKTTVIRRALHDISSAVHFSSFSLDDVCVFWKCRHKLHPSDTANLWPTSDGQPEAFTQWHTKRNP